MDFVEIENNAFDDVYGIQISNSFVEIKNSILCNNEAFGEKGK